MKFNIFKTLFLFLATTINIIGQKNIYSSSTLKLIEKHTQYLETIGKQNIKIVENLAKKLNIDIRQTLGSGNILELKGENEIGEPIFTITESNLQSGQTTRTNSLFDGGKLGLNQNGSGITTNGRLGIWDGGSILNDHVEFGNRITQIDTKTTTSSHATHVAGTMVAEGININARGMAPGAVLKAWDFNNDDAEMASASKELLVSNHSYGQVCGWVFNDNRSGNAKWEWYGNTQINAFEDYKFGFYDNQSAAWDKIAYDAPNYLIVKSAGNKRNENGPGISKTDTTKTLEKYYLGAGTDSSFVARSRNDGFDNLPTYSVAKNILTVGAVSIIPNGPSTSSDIKIASFSSYGPTDDGRIKPDIVGVGVNLFSTTDINTTAYSFQSGTSMSSPQVAGSIFLLQELYAQLNSNKMMRSATLKGLVLHTANDAGKPGPDYAYGWGLLDMEKAAKLIINKPQTHFLAEESLMQGSKFTKKIIANGIEPLVITICWTDPEGIGTSATQSNINNRSPKLINDLDVTINDGLITYKAWILDPNKPANSALKGDNFRDNVEQVYIQNPIPGKEYTITITHKSVLKNGVQDYAILGSGIGGTAYCTSKPNSINDTKIEKITFESLNIIAENGCTSYTDNTKYKLEITPNQKVEMELALGSCGVQKDKSYAIYADWNIDGDFDDIGEKLTENPILGANLQNKISFNAPSDILPGGNTRLRIVVAETNIITPCGVYANGETMDILVSYINPKTDLSVTKLLFPTENICLNSSIDNISFLVENKGTTVANNGEIIIGVSENGEKYENLSFKIGTPIPPLSNIVLSFPINLTFKANATYKFDIRTVLINDENKLNDIFTIERKVTENTNSEAVKAIECNNSNQVTLIAKGVGATYWYDAPTGGNLIAVGNNVSYPKPTTTISYYASQNDLHGTIGPKTKKEFAGGTYSGNFGPKPLITTKAPIRLESARLYIGHSGKIIFTVERVSDQTPISTVTLDVVATRNPTLGNAPNGQQLDDPADQGAVYNLGLNIPEAGSYQISIEYEDGASIFRSNQGVSGFPFSLNNIVNITGSLFDRATLTAAWYYFYDLKLSSIGCPSISRTIAEKSTALSTVPIINVAGATSICPNESTILSTIEKEGLNYQWIRDTTAIALANSAILKVTQKGNYFVKVSDSGVCPTASGKVSIQIKSPKAPSVLAEANTLTASESESYQWLLARQPIAGATNKTFTSYQSGSYSVLAKVDGCHVASNEVFVTILADEKINGNQNLSIFPNPAFSEINFMLNEKAKIATAKYQLFNSLGQISKFGNIPIIENKFSGINIQELPVGSYILNLQIGERRFLKKIIKE